MPENFNSVASAVLAGNLWYICQWPRSFIRVMQKLLYNNTSNIFAWINYVRRLLAIPFFTILARKLFNCTGKKTQIAAFFFLSALLAEYRNAIVKIKSILLYYITAEESKWLNFQQFKTWVLLSAYFDNDVPSLSQLTIRRGKINHIMCFLFFSRRSCSVELMNSPKEIRQCGFFLFSVSLLAWSKRV